MPEKEPPFIGKEIGMPDEDTGEFVVEEGTGEKWVGRAPGRPPAIERMEKKESFWEKLSEKEKKEIQERANEIANERIKKEGRGLSPAEIDRLKTEILKEEMERLAKERLREKE